MERETYMAKGGEKESIPMTFIEEPRRNKTHKAMKFYKFIYSHFSSQSFNNMATLVFILVVVLILIGLVRLSLRPSNFPPGPRGWPLVGNFPLLFGDEPRYTQLQILAKTYGPVIGLFLGPVQPYVSVTGCKAVKEALLNDDLIGRPRSTIARSRSFGENLGLVLTDGPIWQEQRRFTLRHLRDLGFGKTSIEDQMMDEIQDLIKDIKEMAKSDPNQVVHFRTETFSVSAINILWAITGGKRFQRNDVALKKLLQNVDVFVKNGNPIGGSLPIPQFLIRRFPIIPKLLGFDSRLFCPLQEFVQESIDEHLATRSKGDAPRDFLDVYLDEMEEKNRNYESTFFSHQQLVVAVQDLFIAGSETSSNAIGFALLYLIRHPDVQKRMQTELDEVCGESLPSLAHRSRLPYTEAVLMEVLRLGSVVPLTAPHYALKDTTIQGFRIPKGSLVAINLHSVFQDETMWKDPVQFNPERHLNEQGEVVKNEAFMPYGLGKRMCLGEPLARNTFFLLATTLVKTFEFKSVPGEPLPTLEPIAGITLSPKPYEAVVELRHSSFIAK